jgi:hypothetical protein
MFAIIGFLFLCVMNMVFSLVCGLIFLAGGCDLSPIMTSRSTPWHEKIMVVLLIIMNITVWVALYEFSPLSININ